MKTVEIVKTATGWHVTRRYFSMNKGTEFFPSVAPQGMSKTKAKEFLSDKKDAMQKFIKDWTGE